MSSVSPVFAVVILTVVIVIVYALTYYLRKKEGFTSAKEVYQTSSKMFDETNGTASYSDLKTSLPDIDPVSYNDVRELWKKRELTFENVKKLE